ncbi:MAG: hypothetical protein WDN06_07590 [Asticcacaulis sp.]
MHHRHDHEADDIAIAFKDIGAMVRLDQQIGEDAFAPAVVEAAGVDIPPAASTGR